MRYVLILCLALFTAAGDKLAVQTLACKSGSVFEQLNEATKSDYIKLQDFANRHNCVILSPSDKIQVVAADGDDSDSRFVTIVVRESGERYVVLRRNVQIEQPGQKNQFSF